MYSQITHDIKFEDNDESKKIKNKTMLNDLQDEEVGKNILKELKASINDNAESENGSEFEMMDKLKTPRSISQDYEEVLNKFQSAAASEIVYETLIKEDLNIILKVQETASQISANEDELSMVTLDSSNGGSVENDANAAENIEVVKKKRAYKPRKKKETLQEN